MKKPEESSIALIGAARDIGEFLPSLLRVFEDCFNGFKDVSYFIVENNSLDNTRTVLKNLKKEYANFQPIFLENNIKEIKYKTERIAIARNSAINEIKKLKPSIDYIAVADLDAINLGLTKESVESCWQHTNWSAMFANQPDGYYDIYALRHEIWSPRDFLEDYDSLKETFGEKIALNLSLKSKRIKINGNSKLVEVESAFGGFGIYKASDLLGETYVGIDQFKNPICEHLSVNAGIQRRGGKLFINPKMTNARGYNLITKTKAIVYEKFFRNNKFMGID